MPGLGQTEKENAALFLHLDAAVEKNKVDVQNELTAEVESHLQLLKQNLGRSFLHMTEFCH